MPARAEQPFHFFNRLSLAALAGVKAKDLAELLEQLLQAPQAAVYQHTHRFLEQHQNLVPEPPNDFAYWVTHTLGDEALGERLAAIDTVRFDSLEELRRALAEVLAERLSSGGNSHAVAPGKEFHFMRAVKFSLPTPYVAWDLSEFADCLKKVGVSSLYLHVFEARLRPPLGVNDFSHWFRTQLGEAELASRVSALDPYTHTLEGLRAKIVNLIEARLQEGSHAPS